MWIIGIILVLIVLDFMRPIDSTDKSRLDRSGLSLYIDNETGCHYLSVQSGLFGKGQLIPRLDKDGKHYCEKRP